MQFDPMRPIWLQVMTDMAIQIATGKRQPGEKLPGGRELALQYNINPNTAARVYQELEKQGISETRRGLGTYVTSDTARIALLRGEMAREALKECIKTLQTLGFSAAEAAQMMLEEEK